jgi:predicted negative regulator of RcsB-dependent stress response|tara:strand:+ start:2294 stop:2905 length:612 start_codon:yes stop_codon:yes gene_type:complete
MSDDKLDFTSKMVAWAKDNIKFILVGVVIGIAIPLSWSYMQHLEEQKNLEASELYYDLVDIGNSEEIIKQAKNKISDNHEGSIYDVLTKFILAKQEFENKNYELSMDYLEKIIDIDANDTYNSLARIKISLIHVENKDYDAALKSLDMVKMQIPFKQILSEIKGDIFKYKGDKEKSLKFYNEAINASAINNENLLMKKNSVKK